MAGGQFSDWAPYQNYVQGGMVDGAFANAGFTMIAAGPPRVAQIGGIAAVEGAIKNGQQANQMWMPLGIVQNFSLSQNRQFSRIFEIGSDRSYFIAGRTVGQVGMSRIYYHGPSMLRMMYAYYQDLVPPTMVPALFPNQGSATMANPHDVIVPPGYENIYLNLASDLFSQPVGLLVYMRDNNLDTLGALVLEACYVPNHTWATDAQGVLVQESVALQFERAVPVNVSALTVISKAAGNAGGTNAPSPK